MLDDGGYKVRKVPENNSLKKEIRKLLELCKKDEKDKIMERKEIISMPLLLKKR
jgi:hypothetical protein